MASGVYKITCLVTGKFYIGSSFKANDRMRKHREALRRGKHANRYLQRSWDKYGEDAFDFRMIEPVLFRECLLDREQWWIDRTKCYKRSVGFNLSRSAGSPMLGRKHTKESRAKIGAWGKGRTHGKAYMDAVCGRWIVTDPEGTSLSIQNLLEFCSAHKLKYRSMRSVADGRRKTHHGWICQREDK